MVTARSRGDRFTSSIIQATVAEFVQRGDLDRHLAHYQASPARNQPSAIVMGYSRLTPHHIEEGIHCLAAQTQQMITE